MKGIKAFGALVLGLCLLAATSWPARAWEDEHLLRAGWVYTPAAGFSDGAGEVQISALTADLTLPVFTTKPFSLLFGIHYNGYFMDYSGVPSFTHPSTGRVITQRDLPGDLTALNLSLGAVASLTQSWYVYGEAGLSMNSDGQEISNHDIVWQGAALLGLVLSKGAELQLGLSYSDAFGENQIIPLLGLRYQAGPNWRVDLLLPLRAQIGRKLGGPLTLGLKAQLTGHEFRLSQDAPWRDTVLKFHRLTAGPYLDIKLVKSLVARLEAGYTFYQTFEFRAADSDRKLYEGDLDNTWFLGVWLRWGL